MTGFSEDWLSLRESADFAARNPDLLIKLQAWRSKRSTLHITDLGTGTGSNLRYLAPRLGGEQQWQLVDNDAKLLDALPGLLRRWGTREQVTVEERSDRTIQLSGQHFTASVSRLQRDLAQPLDSELFAETHLVTASALLDLASRSWMNGLANGLAERLVEGIANRLSERPAEQPAEHPPERPTGQPAERLAEQPIQRSADDTTHQLDDGTVQDAAAQASEWPSEHTGGKQAVHSAHDIACLFVLNVDGRMQWHPAVPGDEEIRARFNQHQQTDKGLGVAAGPHAGQYMAEALGHAGFDVFCGQSDWQLGTDSTPMQSALADGFFNAALELSDATDPSSERMPHQWLAARQRLWEAQQSSLIIGHLDVLGLMPGRS